MSNLLALIPTASWTIGNFLNGTKASIDKYGAIFLMCIGLTLLVYGGIKLFKAVTGRTGSTGPEWLKVVLALLFGGVLFGGSLGIMKHIGEAGQNLTNQLGKGQAGDSISPIVQVEHMNNASNTLSHFVK